MIWRVLGFALWGLIGGAIAGSLVGVVIAGAPPLAGADPAIRSQYYAEKYSELANCAALLAVIGAPLGAVIGWRTGPRKR